MGAGTTLSFNLEQLVSERSLKLHSGSQEEGCKLVSVYTLQGPQRWAAGQCPSHPSTVQSSHHFKYGAKRYTIANRTLLKGVSKSPFGAGLASMHIGSTGRLALQNLQVPEHPTIRTFPISPVGPRHKRLAPSPWRNNKGKCEGNWDYSALATATPPAIKVRHPSQFLSERGRTILWRSNTVKAPGPRISSRPPNSNTVTPATIIQGPSHKLPFRPLNQVWGTIYTLNTLEALKELGLDTHKATKLALKFHAHSVQYAFKFASTRHALEKASTKSHHQDQARATASKPPDPH
eukprot:1157521-Pelagomonas_calceolata.AAC.17